MTSYFLFKTNWGALWREVWTPLSKKTSAPVDLFIELYRFAGEKLGSELKAEALNDPNLAKEEFKRLPCCPSSEKACVDILEGFVGVLSEFEGDVSQQYCSLLDGFIERHNLRYILTQNSKLRLSLMGLLVSQYSTFKKAISQNEGRLECLRELETNIGNLSDEDIERNCMRIASNLLEGIVVDKTTNGEHTLGKAIAGCEQLFPHKAVIESVKNFYKFFNDYPNLRHPGTQAQRIRDLKKDDAVLSIWFAVMFASFLAGDNAFELISLGDF